MTETTEIQAGDLVFCHSKGAISRAIRIAQWVRWRKGSKFNHVAIIDEIKGDTVYVIQAESSGVTGKNHHRKTLDQIAIGGTYEIVKPPSKTVRTRILYFAREQVGSRYGFFTIVSILMNILSPKWFVAIRLANTWICSAVTAESLRYGGWYEEWYDIYQVTPAELYLALTK
ncbi:MAG: YiiX/YebB-like N1pC/P60 family cysteine hydrolase [Bacteroidota bacterium]